ncbi:hypothetical protein R84B8_01885 [Treponema sp. R8-4-B8]
MTSTSFSVDSKSKKMKSCKLFGLIVLTLAIGLLTAACDSSSDGGNPDKTDTGSNIDGTGGGANNNPGGNALSGMYYREFEYNEYQIQFNSDGSYTLTNSLGTETGAYAVSDNKVTIKNFTFNIYDSNTLTLASIGNSNNFPITFLKDGSYYPVSGTYSATVGGARFYWTFDSDGTCALDGSANSGKDRFKWSYTISERMVYATYMPVNSTSDNYKFVTIDSNTIKDASGYLWRKQ